MKQAQHRRKTRIIGIDLMGSDHSPSMLLDALRDLTLPRGVEILAIGTSDFAKKSPVPFHPAEDFVAMDENPLAALRKKKQASMFVGLRLLKQGKIDALVSSGNTGALVTGAKTILSCLPGILRPALLALMPTKKEPIAVLDLGANIQCKAKHLVQFARMGAAYLQSRGRKNPAIGLLNIGSESIKGTSELRQAYQTLHTLPHPSFRFAGNIEGQSVFEGDVDALVTDGFTGNVFLKTAEGVANLLLSQKNAVAKHIHSSALLIGVRGIVIKCHGYATPGAFQSGIREAIDLATKNFMDTFSSLLD